MNSASVKDLSPDIQALVKSRRTLGRSIVIASLGAILMMAVLLFNTIGRNNESDANGRRLDELTQQLVSTKAALQEAKEQDIDRASCASRLSINSAAAAKRQADARDGLLLAIAKNPAGAPERVAAVETAFTELAAARVARQAADDLAATYTPEVPALPCPLDMPHA